MQKKKGLALVLSFALVACLAVAGTLAWLTDKTDTVTNTFTVGNINIELDEAEFAEGALTGDRTTEGNEYQMIPGTAYPKDPTVTVNADSEECFLFVKFEEKNDADLYLTYKSTLTVENGWELLDGTENVWFRVVPASDEDQSWKLLGGTKGEELVIDSQAVTELTMEEAKKAELVYTAYAIQTANMADANEAWTALQGQINA